MIRICVAMIGLVVGCAGVAYAQDAAAEARRLATATVEAARAGLKNEQLAPRSRELFWRSQCVLFAELELCETPQARLDAFQSHINRCKDFEKKLQEMEKQKLVPVQDTLDGQYFRVRAEYWLAREKLAQSQGKSAGEDSQLPIPAAPPRRP